MKHSLAAAYGAKRSALSRKSKGCPDCSPEAKCMAHGGEVQELEEAHESVEMAPHEMVDQDVSGPEESDMADPDHDGDAESHSLAAQIMRDRKRQRMAAGGEVEPAEELDAPEEDGRDSRGLNLEPVHVMEDDEHDQSDASLVAQILKDRKRNRRGM